MLVSLFEFVENLIANRLPGLRDLFEMSLHAGIAIRARKAYDALTVQCQSSIYLLNYVAAGLPQMIKLVTHKYG